MDSWVVIELNLDLVKKFKGITQWGSIICAESFAWESRLLTECMSAVQNTFLYETSNITSEKKKWKFKKRHCLKTLLKDLMREDDKRIYWLN